MVRVFPKVAGWKVSHHPDTPRLDDSSVTLLFSMKNLHFHRTAPKRALTSLAAGLHSLSIIGVGSTAVARPAASPGDLPASASPRKVTLLPARWPDNKILIQKVCT